MANPRALLAAFIHSNPTIFRVTDAWEPLLAVASSEYILPALYPHFHSLNLLRSLPPEISSSLQTISHLNRERNQLILSQSHSIISALNGAGIEPIALKGLAYLHSGIFPDPAARYLLDLDFLIPEPQLPAAIAALAQVGYTPYLGDTLAQFRHHAPQMHHPHSIPVELHRSIGLGLSSQILPASDIISFSSSLHSNNATLRLPSPDHLLTHLVLHSQVRHTYHDRIFPPLRAMYDLLLLTRHFAHELDWSSIQNRFSAHGQHTTLLLHLLQVHETLGMPLPFPIHLSPIAKFRWLRRRLLNRHPALRFLDPSYLLISAFSRRFHLLRAIFAVPGGWKKALKMFASPGSYRRLLSDL